MTARVSPPMLKALRKVSVNEGTGNIPFRTGEALRKRGLLNRYSKFVARAYYVTADSSTKQPWENQYWHEWETTRAGVDLLVANDMAIT